MCIRDSYSNGAAVLPWACKNPVASHQWRVQGTQFQQVGSGRCAEFNPGSNTAQVQPCNRPNQAWAVEDVDGASSSALQFRSASTAGDRFDGCLDIDGTTRSGYANNCLLYTSDAADERSSVDLGGRRIIKKKQQLRRDKMNKHIQKTNI